MPQTYTVQIQHQNNTYTIEVPADKIILRAASAAGLELPSRVFSLAMVRRPSWPVAPVIATVMMISVTLVRKQIRA